MPVAARSHRTFAPLREGDRLVALSNRRRRCRAAQHAGDAARARTSCRMTMRPPRHRPIPKRGRTKSAADAGRRMVRATCRKCRLSDAEPIPARRCRPIRRSKMTDESPIVLATAASGSACAIRRRTAATSAAASRSSAPVGSTGRTTSAASSARCGSRARSTTTCRRDIDTFGGIFAGWDWDHYWGNELHFDWATPELINSEAPRRRSHRLAVHVELQLHVLPVGRFEFVPIGGAASATRTSISRSTTARARRMAVDVSARRRHEVSLSALARRPRRADRLLIARNDDCPTQHNLTLTFGLEWRFGAHPRSYWPWNPAGTSGRLAR